MHLPGNAPPAPTTSTQASMLQRIPPLGWVAIILVASIVVSFVTDYLLGQWIDLDPSRIREWLDQLGWRAPLVFIILMIAAVVVSPIPSVPLDIAAGLAFGLVWGTIYTLIGAEIGAMVAFLIARQVGRPRMARWVPRGAMMTIDRVAEHRGFFTIFIMRLLPLFSFDWVSYGAGLSAIRFQVFMAATLLGMIPPVIAIVAVGATLPSSPLLAGIIFGALILALILPLASPRFRTWATGVPEPKDPLHDEP